jgi:hypothetical protein
MHAHVVGIYRVCTYLQDVLFRDPFRNRREVQRELLTKISILSPQRRERAVRKHARVVHFSAVWSKCTLSLHVLCQNISLFPCSLFALSVPSPSLLCDLVTLSPQSFPSRIRVL